MKENKFIRRGEDKFEYIESIKKCQWCKKETKTYDVIGIAMCSDCIKRISRINKYNGDIKVRNI